MLVAVTGSSGFIGRAVCAELLARDHGVLHADLPEFDVRTEIEFDADVDAVVHLAGKLGTHELFDCVADAVTTNVTGTANVLEAARQTGASYVGITVPPVFPSVYTATKLAAQHLERAWHHAYHLPVSRVRAFNVYGPGQKHGPGHPQKIIPTFATEALAGRPVPIWGDGTQTVDLMHVTELARMLVDALAYGADATFDGGTGTPFTVNEVAEMVLDITGSRAGVRHLPPRRGEIPTKVVAAGEGWDKLGWRPEFDAFRFEAAVESYAEAEHSDSDG
jgi:UDP-glucose 4-epimerase